MAENPNDHMRREAVSLAVVLYRLDNLDHAIGQLVTVEAHLALRERVSHLERSEREREEWGRNVVAGVFLAVAGAAASLVLTLIGA